MAQPHLGDNGGYGPHRNTTAQAEYLQRKRRKDASKQKVDVEKDRKFEVVIRSPSTTFRPAPSAPKPLKVLFVKLPKAGQGYADRVLRHGAVLRRILNHTAPKGDVLHRHYVGLNEGDVVVGLVKIQTELTNLMRNDHQPV